MNDEINIIVALNEDKTEIVGAFTDREEAINLFKKLLDIGVLVSIHSIEINTYKEFITEFNL